MKTTFTSKLLGFGNNTGIEVPAANVEALGSSKKPPVKVSVNGFTYKSTVAVMRGKFMIAFPKANREATGLAAGDDITVVLELDDGIREVVVPDELADALRSNAVLAKFNGLAYSKRKEFVRQVADAKSDETRLRRIQKVIDVLSVY